MGHGTPRVSGGRGGVNFYILFIDISFFFYFLQQFFAAKNRKKLIYQ
jgi:hypothetical protein